MQEGLTLWITGIAIVAVLVACYPIATWIKRQWSLRAAERIARSMKAEQTRARIGARLQESSERYRIAKVRANLGAKSGLYAAAEELVREHRLSTLERR
jgi:hypothetical protein